MNYYKTIPYEYQKEKIKEVYNSLIQNNICALFAATGTGKSLISLNVACNLFVNNNIQVSIIIMPKTLILSWIDQLESHINMDLYDLFIWDSIKSKSKKYINNFIAWTKSNLLKILIINIESFSSHNIILNKILKYIDNKNKLIIVDESTKIKTYNSNRTKNIIKIFKNEKYKMIMTGTEITNSIMDLYSQYEFLKYFFWGYNNFYQFRNVYGILKDQYIPGGKTVKIVIGYQKLDQLNEKIKDVTVRISKDILGLPDQVYQNVKLEMSSNMSKIYSELKENLYSEYKNKELLITEKIALFTRFRQIVGGFFPGNDCAELTKIDNNIKIKYLLDEFEDSSEEKIIIWCNFINEIKLLVESLNKNFNDPLNPNPKYCISYYGGLTDKERNDNIIKFKNDPDCRFIIMNNTGAFGLNLQFARTIYYYSLTTSPENYWQSQDRIYRNGQTKNSLYKILLYQNTIDERLKYLIDNKTNIAAKFKNGSIDDFINFV